MTAVQQTSEALREWFHRVEPMCPELFNAAYAMCGNYELAEQALCGAVLELWAQDASPGIGFRERARGVLREEVFDILSLPQAQGMELTWPGFPDPQSNDPVLRQAAQERTEVQRALLLKHGCGLSVRTVAALIDAEPEKVRAALERFETRCRRNLSGQNRSRADAIISRRMQQLLTRPMSGAPSAAQVYRAFEAEASKSQTTTRRLPHIIGRALVLIMALMCGVIFWLFAVLVQPTAPRLEASAPVSESETLQEEPTLSAAP